MSEMIEEQAEDVINRTQQKQEVISYIRTLDGTTHEALDSINNGVIFDNANAIYIIEPPLPSLDDEAEHEAKLFAESLKSYESEVPKEYKTGINIDQTHCVEDVIKQIDSAVKNYKHETEKTAWQAIRKCFWKLSESKGLENWLSLIPSSTDYASLICGGLTLILKAAGRIGDVRSEAFRGLAEIPFHLQRVGESVRVFDESEALRKCGFKLYTVTLIALAHVLKWFKKRAIGKTFGALLKQGAYQKELFDKIKEIETVSTRFKDISISCMQREVVKTGKTVASLAEASNHNNAMIKNTVAQTTQTLERHESSNISLHKVTQQMIHVEQELSQQNADTLNHLKTLLESFYATFCESLQQSNDPPAYEAVSKKGSSQTSEILSILGHEKDISEPDLQQNLRGLNTLTRPEQDRAVWAMKSPALRSWLLSTSSTALIINGSCSSSRVKSPVSFVCARLVDSIESQAKDNFIVLHFFCGQHLSFATDENATPLQLMISLLTQLLLQHPDFDVSSQDLINLSPVKLESVQKLFGKLIGQLGTSWMVFCIIDGISFYEDAARLEGTKKLIHGLVELVQKFGGGLVFKLLLTSPTRVRNVPDTVKRREVLNVPKEVGPQSGLSLLRGSESISGT